MSIRSAGSRQASAPGTPCKMHSRHAPSTRAPLHASLPPSLPAPPHSLCVHGKGVHAQQVEARGLGLVQHAAHGGRARQPRLCQLRVKQHGGASTRLHKLVPGAGREGGRGRTVGEERWRRKCMRDSSGACAAHTMQGAEGESVLSGLASSPARSLVEARGEQVLAVAVLIHTGNELAVGHLQARGRGGRWLCKARVAGCRRGGGKRWSTET